MYVLVVLKIVFENVICLEIASERNWCSVFLQEELGIEYDEDVGVSLQSFGDLLQHGNKRSRCQ